jgi:hypothetical protein
MTWRSSYRKIPWLRSMNRQDAENYFPLKTTKAFERGLEGLEMVAPRIVPFANRGIPVP